MPAYKEMDPADVRRVLAGQTNILAEDEAKEQAFFRTVTCPACGSGGLNFAVDPRRPFTPGARLANKTATCATCQTEFDPYTRLVRRTTASPG